MDQNEASHRREVAIKNPVTDRLKYYRGDEVYSITNKGIVVAVGPIRIFYPWHKIEYFNYHNDDVSARKVIQGY